ncbi:hypothetical protein [Neobacillus mesonae]|uniref:hypothetical protein n=1 Tax=Neobacillus mesonae TaxID=1193713 RepID=UPI00203AC61A|nr:hypothetical protein [Neobacillus mesonae]MCM3570437.1 hypothetical protein [Neobacillus mesonae]
MAEENKPYFRKESIKPSHENEPAYNVFLNETLVAEVRGSDPQHQTVIPMRALSDYEEDKLHEYIAAMCTEDNY